ncbi:DUF4124 domain-containing protein [Stenotrophomonas sp. HITSZ_GD]|uniref:DUF4124 domain-containing protein n=1 Tax=Stenotrophomonas sp. HITSZ_GD TaxID=3037248 RepID=UPI00240E87E2|nr:DUF4124 domain-containing protein [Stenotrophomonas sp. HITSZ_GD]MDG2525117.1 DUF4124 domain-containing protein [Stenotrophomonas sp. HITSZ_GD]
MKPLLTLFLSVGLAAPAGAADTAPNVRIYRCVGSNGAIALQDAPCTKGQQQVIDMQRPQDPPPRRISTDDVPAAAAPSQQAPREIRIIQTPAPQPMYECITEDGQRYTSDTPDGNPRWVPTWTYAYAGGRPRPPGPRPPQGGPPDGGHRPPPPGPRPGGAVIVPYGSVQIRDECHALPQREVCSRLSDRRWDIIRRYNSALQSEREQLTREQRGIDARLEQDCGGT